MKFSIISAIILGVAATVFAEDRFDLPNEGSSYAVSDTISFSVDDLTDDDNKKINAVLFDYQSSLQIKSIGDWPANINGADKFNFQWRVDVGPGYYEVCVYEIEEREHDDDDDEHDDRVELKSCSHPFTVGGVATSNRKKRSIYAA